MASKDGQGRSGLARVLSTSTPNAASAMKSCVKRSASQIRRDGSVTHGKSVVGSWKIPVKPKVAVL